MTLSPVAASCAVAAPRDSRWAVLGGLRFVLAALVFIGHAQYSAPAYHWMQSVSQFGSFAAVLGFFLVSGYSIAHSYHQRPGGFLRRRVQRLAPAYLTAFLLALVPLWLLTTDRHLYEAPPLEIPTLLQFFANGLCLQGSLAPAISSNMPVWSLGAEVVYYALTPLLFRLRSRLLLALLGASVLLYLAHGLSKFGLGYYRYPSESHGVSAVCLLWAWLAGFLLWRHPGADWSRWLMVGTGCVLLGFDDTQHYKFSVAVYLAAALLVIYATRIRVPPRLVPWLSYLGDLSFPLYLVHFPLLLILHSWYNVTTPAPLLLIPLAAAVLVHHAIEVPLHRRATRRKGSGAVGLEPLEM